MLIVDMIVLALILKQYQILCYLFYKSAIRDRNVMKAEKFYEQDLKKMGSNGIEPRIIPTVYCKNLTVLLNVMSEFSL